jgi:hypothetical protein
MIALLEIIWLCLLTNHHRHSYYYHLVESSFGRRSWNFRCYGECPQEEMDPSCCHDGFLMKRNNPCTRRGTRLLFSETRSIWTPAFQIVSLLSLVPAVEKVLFYCHDECTMVKDSLRLHLLSNTVQNNNNNNSKIKSYGNIPTSAYGRLNPRRNH